MAREVIKGDKFVSTLMKRRRVHNITGPWRVIAVGPDAFRLSNGKQYWRATWRPLIANDSAFRLERYDPDKHDVLLDSTGRHA